MLDAKPNAANAGLVTPGEGRLAHAPATVEQLLAFKAGDFIELDLNKIIQAKIDGVPVFDCYYGTSNNKYALRVEKLLTAGTSSWLGDQHV